MLHILMALAMFSAPTSMIHSAAVPGAMLMNTAAASATTTPTHKAKARTATKNKNKNKNKATLTKKKSHRAKMRGRSYSGGGSWHTTRTYNGGSWSGSVNRSVRPSSTINSTTRTYGTNNRTIINRNYSTSRAYNRPVINRTYVSHQYYHAPYSYQPMAGMTNLLVTMMVMNAMTHQMQPQYVVIQPGQQVPSNAQPVPGNQLPPGQQTYTTDANGNLLPADNGQQQEPPAPAKPSFGARLLQVIGVLALLGLAIWGVARLLRKS